MIDSSQKFV